jgi:ubiquinone/menaquinone biosynthesis C-methylase UbiE
LPFGHFDLAYCKRVLTNMEDDQEIQLAIGKMTKVVKPGGWVIAVEDMPDKQWNPRPREVLASMFGKAGLTERRLNNAPEVAYCYRKLFAEAAPGTEAA